MDGRNLAIAHHEYPEPTRFNPRPPSWTGATVRFPMNDLPRRPFQSSPALMDGRNHQTVTDQTEDQEVSILARPHGRAQPPISRFTAIQIRKFQSSPALMDGRNWWWWWWW